MTRQEDEKRYSLTWETHKNPWYFTLLLVIFFFVNMGYIGWLLAYILSGGLYAWIFFFVELYRITFCAIAYYSMHTVTLPVHEAPHKKRTVDVLIPTLNEDIEVLTKTITGARDIKGVRDVFVLDDGNRPHVKELADSLGVKYGARTEHNHAKAGNMNFGLGLTDAEFIITFDADHVGTPHFLERTLGYFNDPEVAFVQTPQVFYNRSSFQHREVKGWDEWSEQTMFYDGLQPAKNTFNAAFYCGSSAILRRAAVDDVGGFATGTATEDIHTAIRIHSKGWKSVFIPERLAYGLAPDDLKEYYRQRVRWGAGSLGLFFRTPDSPLRTKGLTLRQRLCYTDSMLGFMQGEVKLLYFCLPVGILFTSAAHLPVSVSLLLFLHLLYLIFMGIMTYIYSRRTYHPIFTEQYNIANIFSNIASLKGVIRIQKKFGVSIKTKKKMESSYIPFALMGFLGILTFAELYGLISGYFFSGKNFTFLLHTNAGLALFWNLYNIGMIGSFLYFIWKHQKRKVVNVEKLHIPVRGSAIAFSSAMQ